MTYIPARPIIADDPLAYFAALNVPKARAEPNQGLVQPQPADRALDLMYGYYSAE